VGPDLVLDGSVVMAWALPDELSDYADRVLLRLATLTVVVPRLWPFEIANTLLLGERRSRIAASESAEFVRRLLGIGIAIDEGPWPSIAHLVEVGRSYGTSGYDAAYLDLAQRHGIPLATLDKAQKAAAPKMGVALFDVG